MTLRSHALSWQSQLLSVQNHPNGLCTCAVAGNPLSAVLLGQASWRANPGVLVDATHAYSMGMLGLRVVCLSGMQGPALVSILTARHRKCETLIPQCAHIKLLCG